MKVTQTLKTIVLFLTVIISNDCIARAGGGGSAFVGGSTSGSILMTIIAFVLAPILFIYSAIVTVMLERKRNKVRDLVEEISKKDRIWNYRNMKARVEDTFFKVQNAWSENNQDLAKDYMSDRIYQKHKLQADDLISKGVKNVIQRINIDELMIYSASDYKDNSLDTFSVQIKGSMIDYMIDTLTENVISGDNSKPESFKEIWTFVRQGNNWVLDEIDQAVSMGDIRQGRAYSEK